MDKEMSEREAFEHLWLKGIQTMQYRSEKERAEMWWQAACKWQREALAAWIKPQRNDIPATGEEFSAAILNQGSKE